MVVEDVGGVAAVGAGLPLPGEPEKLVLPAPVLEELVRIALRTEVGAFGWRVFVQAHGAPSWLAAGHWRLRVPDAAVLPADPGEES